MTPTRPSHEVRVELDAAKARAIVVARELREAEARVKDLKAESDHLTGPWSNDRGQVGRLTAELTRAEEAERIAREDETAPRVTVETTGWQAGRAEVVLVKVTPKRIVTRQLGGSYESQWQHDGTPVASYGSSRLLDAARIVAEHGGRK